jgi:hypothetical protein
LAAAALSVLNARQSGTKATNTTTTTNSTSGEPSSEAASMVKPSPSWIKVSELSIGDQLNVISLGRVKSRPDFHQFYPEQYQIDGNATRKVRSFRPLPISVFSSSFSIELDFENFRRDTYCRLHTIFVKCSALPFSRHLFLTQAMLLELKDEV